MGDRTGISWTFRTYNPWQGCAKVSPGCDYCYMFRDKIRFGQDPEVVVRSKPQTFNRPLRWEREAAAANRQDLVFTCSWSDWFIKEADEWRPDAWAMVKKTPHLIYQILTKRPSRIARCLPPDWGSGYPNVWLGVSAENQNEAERRVPLLIDVPARVHFVSVEPQLGLVNLSLWLQTEKQFSDALMDAVNGLMVTPIEAQRGFERFVADRRTRAQHKVDWVIYGGESGTPTTSRPTDVAWIREGVRECRALKAAAFVKQLGSPWAREVGAKDDAGSDMSEWPEDIRVRDFPDGYVAAAAIAPTDPGLVEL